MSTPLILIMLLLAVVIRQIDRLWFRVRSDESALIEQQGLKAIKEIQRTRLNNFTPWLVVGTIWIEIVACLMVAQSRHWLALCIVSAFVAVKFRHLQEITHFAMHGCLAKSRALGDRIAEYGFQAPLALPPLKVRHEQHVRRHHPNAALPGVDPNLDDLAKAGIHRDCTATAFVMGTVYPMTPRGVLQSTRSIGIILIADLKNHRVARLSVLPALILVSLILGGTPALIFGLAIPRLVIYPQLSWMSLLVEHRWFVSQSIITTSRQAEEATRCIRLYQGRNLWSLAARATWLPFGDLFHYEHSVHPWIRWNYLPVTRRVVTIQPREFSAAVVGSKSALKALFQEAKQ